MSGPRRFGAAHLVIDESTAMATARDDPRAGRVGFWATGLAVFACWNTGTAIGAVGASVLANPRSLGLDAAAPAAFVAAGVPVLLAAPSRCSRGRRSWSWSPRPPHRRRLSGR